MFWEAVNNTQVFAVYLLYFSLQGFSFVHSYLRNNLITCPMENYVFVKRIEAFFIAVYRADNKPSMDQYVTFRNSSTKSHID